MSVADYLKFLGISFNASPEEIKTAYARISRRFHSGRRRNEYLTAGLKKYRKFIRNF